MRQQHTKDIINIRVDSRVFETNTRIHANLQCRFLYGDDESFVYHSLSVTQCYRIAS